MEDDAMENKPMTPSDMEPMTNGQIAKLTDVIAAKLRKSKISSEAAQIVLGNSNRMNNIADIVVESFRDHIAIVDVAGFDGVIIRTVYVDDSLSPQEVLDATGCEQYVNDDVVANMPRCEGGEKRVYFIPSEILPNKYKDGQWVRRGSDLEQALNELGYKLACPYAVAKINELDPYFALKHSNATQWKDKKGEWCYIGFQNPSPQRNEVSVYRVSTGFSLGWYFAAEKIEE